MKLIKLYCPSCGAPTTIEEDNQYREYLYCAHCGSKILLDEDNTKRYVDVGKIKEEENKKYIFDKERELQKQEILEKDKLLEEQKKRGKKELIIGIFILLLCIILGKLFSWLNISGKIYNILGLIGCISIQVACFGLWLIREANEKKLKNHKID